MLALISLPLISSASVLDQPMPVIDMLHASWTARDGAPAGITGITQTPDGWIWVGSTSGLYKFDGVRFQRMTGPNVPLSSNVSAIGTLRDGTLWVGYQYGGVSLLRGARFQHYRLDDPATPAGIIRDAVLDNFGRIWLATGRGLYYLDAGSNWHRADAALGAPEDNVFSLLLDRHSVLWVRGGKGVYALPQAANRFDQRMELKSPYGFLAQHPDGSVWTTTTGETSLFQLSPPDAGASLHWTAELIGPRFIFDHEGYVWDAEPLGLMRSGPRGTLAQRTSAENGLSGQKVGALFEDRERNIWVGTESGLDRFRAPRVRALTLPPFINTQGRAIAGGAGGSAWIDSYYLADTGATPRPFAPASGTSSNHVVSLYRAADGKAWAGGNHGELWAIEADGLRLIPRPEGPIGWYVFSLAQDVNGTFWLATGRSGVHAWRAGNWSPGGGIPELASFAAATVAAGADGRVWFGSVNDQVALLDRGRLRHYGRADGLAIGTTTQILPQGQGAWIGGENGLVWFDGRRFIPIIGRDGEPFAGITGLVFARDGTLWLNGAGGVSSIASDELRRVLSAPGYTVRFGRLDYRDGLAGAVSPILPLPSASRSDDGTLWFSTVSGVYAFDPAKLTRNTIVPPVLITGLKTGVGMHNTSEGLRLPPSTDLLEISFTALSYREPERMGFRYKLDGFDRDWRNGDGHRMASYTNLGPGHYRFRVIASNDDGVWNTTGATLSFDIAPALTQTLWFRALCVIAAILGAWRLQWLWMRRTARRLAARMDARMAEREHIARELHDTLLQSVQGLSMFFSAAVQKLAPAERAPLEAAIERANLVVGEGRDRVSALRSAAVPDADLIQALQRFGDTLAQDGRVAFTLEAQGTPRKLQAESADEAFAIAREALWNAAHHASASNISAVVHFAPSGLIVIVHDDGRGLPPDVLAAGACEGHWGIRGMFERARVINATLIPAVVGKGTTWTLKIPASVAFA